MTSLAAQHVMAINKKETRREKKMKQQ